MIIFTLILISIFSGITTYLVTTLFAMMLNNTNNVVKLYTNFTPLNLMDKYSPDKSFSNKLIRILSMYTFYITGIAGIVICMVIHRILYEIFEVKNDTNIQYKSEAYHMPPNIYNPDYEF